MITENLSTLKIHKLTQEQYERELANGNIDETALYLTPEEEIDFSPYATVEQMNGKADAEHIHTIADVTDLQTSLDEMSNAISGKAASSHSHTITAIATDDDVIVLTGTNGANEVTFDAKHATSGVTAGAYKSVTVNEYGHVTGGSNPTTLSGYGITDAYTKTQVDSIASSKANATHTHNISDVTDLQSSLDAKQAIVTGGASTITSSNLTASMALVSDSSGKVAVSAVTSTELGYLNGVTSSIQTQLNAKPGESSGMHGEIFNDYHNNTASGAYSHSEGYNTTASGDYSHTEGRDTIAAGVFAHAGGYGTIANNFQHVVGKYNAERDAPADVNTQDSTGNDAIFVVGYGTPTTRANAFRITSGGKCRGVSTFTASGADFAELFEWKDGNPDNEDRRGLFVTLDGEKIRLANADDDYIGVISGAQSFVGNTASEEWQGKYLTDVFGARLSQKVEIAEKIDEATGDVIPAHTTTQFIVNPDYNPDEEYIMRENRKEWGTVGLLGQVVVIDDGTCTVGGYTKPLTNGIGTASDTGYRVMKRIDENHIKVLVR